VEGGKWIGGFRQFCEKDDALSGCENAISKCLDDLKKRQKQFQQAKRETITLESLESGQVARLIRVKGKGTIVDKLKELDITPGSIIELEDVEASDGQDQHQGARLPPVPSQRRLLQNRTGSHPADLITLVKWHQAPPIDRLQDMMFLARPGKEAAVWYCDDR
jgi:hypothetical protein